MASPNYGTRKSLGYQRLTSLGSSIGLTIPAKTSLILITPDAQAVRWRDDGTAPTASSGHPLAVGGELRYDSSGMESLRFIEQTAGAILNVTYYGPL
jgi:hypothetical protein